jgi:hypothetical protein
MPDWARATSAIVMAATARQIHARLYRVPGIFELPSHIVPHVEAE